MSPKTEMTQADIELLRTKLGDAFYQIQSEYKTDFTPEAVLPHLIVSLISLAHMVGTHTGMTDEEFLDECQAYIDLGG